MILFKKCVLCVALLFVTGSASGCKGPRGNLKLELIQVLFRHGERTPQSDEIKLMPEANSHLVEPWGFSQLTNNGKRQEYKIGKLLRQLYNNFLGPMYRPENVYATSTDYDRTKASLELVLAALYPPTDELVWNEGLKWDPIPIHFLPRPLDNLFSLDNCERHAKLWFEILESDEVRKIIMTQYGELIKYMERFFPNTEMNLEQLFYLHNVITITKSLNISDPKWYTPAVHEKIRQASKFYLDTMSYTPELIRLNGGSLTRRMIENMDIYDKKPNNPRKIYLYSGHEFTVYAVAKALNVTLKISPTYGSAFIFEKLRDEQGKLYVKVNYWTGTGEELVLIKLNGCGKVCPIEKYLKIVGPNLSTDQDMHCLFDNLTIDDLMQILRTDKIGIPS